MLWGCGQKQEKPTTPQNSGAMNSGGDSSSGGYGDYGYGSEEIKFLDTADSQSLPEVGLYDLMLTAADGQETSVRDLGKGKNVVLVVTRGNTNPICPYCSTQTAHYIRDYEKFQEQEAEVVIVYPVEAKDDQKNLDSFLEDARGRLDDPKRTVPFPVVFDVELSAVNRLGIRKDLSKPATYIISPDGQVLYAYVGAHWGDRPATALILTKLKESKPAADATDANT